MTTEYLLEREVGHVLAALTPVNRLVMQIALHTGLRISDVLSLRYDRIKLHFWVTESKTGKKKHIGIPQELITQIEYFHKALHWGKSPWAFPSVRDPAKHRTRQAVWKDVKRAARAFRLPQNVGPHSFRKVYAVQQLEKYGDVKKVQRALNHGNIETTMIYVMAAQLLEAKKARRLSTRS